MFKFFEMPHFQNENWIELNWIYLVPLSSKVLTTWENMYSGDGYGAITYSILDLHCSARRIFLDGRVLVL